MLGNVIYSGALEMLSLHHIHQKVKYYGCFLFSTYIVIVRAKKSTVYEPKHWFPLRQFTLQNLRDDEGQSISAPATLETSFKCFLLL